MKFDPNASPQCYRSNDEIIQKDTKVRIQIVGCRVEANELVSFPPASELPGRAVWDLADSDLVCHRNDQEGLFGSNTRRIVCFGLEPGSKHRTGRSGM